MELVAVTYHPEQPGQAWWDRTGRPYTSPALSVVSKPVHTDAVGFDGLQHYASVSSRSSSDVSDTLTATFAYLSLTDIKEYRFEKRPYRWTEFQAVALNPASS